MKFEDLNAMIPLAVGGKVKVLSMEAYKNVHLAMPGRHAQETVPAGGDFCVLVSDFNMNWSRHQFTHTDIFKDVEAKRNADSHKMFLLADAYQDVIFNGADPNDNEAATKILSLPGLDPMTFLRATQCLAVAEHRRYARFEKQFGGRYLPLRFTAGIVDGRWSAVDAALKQKMGRPGVEWLERVYGTPIVTQKLMKKLGL